MTLEKKLAETMERTLVDFIAKGEWLKMDYNARINIDAELLRRAHAAVDFSRVLGLVGAAIEQRMADTIMNSMATEVANDVKSIMGNKELREDIRAIIRAKIREAHKALL